MDTNGGVQIRPVREVVRDHIRRVMREHPAVPAYRLAVYLGISPNTLARMKAQWEKEARG